MTENKHKVPYKSLAITFTPTLIIVLVAVLLAFMPKKHVVIDITLNANQISFSVEGMEHLPITTMNIASIMLTNFKKIEFWPDVLRYNSETVPVKGRKVLARPRADAQSPWVKFTGEGMRLEELDIATASQVTFHQSTGEETVDIKVSEKPVEPSEGRISLRNRFTLQMQECELVNAEGSVLIGTDEKIVQKTLEVSPSLDETFFFVSDDRRVFHVRLGILEENVPLFSNASIRHIHFNDYDIHTGKAISTVQNGEVKFKIKKEPISLEPEEFIYLAASDTLKVVKLWSSPKGDGLGITLSGSIDSFKLGKSVLIEQLPSLLEWLAADKRLHIIIAIFVWVIIQTVTIKKLIIDMK
ncbi:hypothetical protein HYR99_16990 [Candidatus Poribacteria bacterium]|nr:hypothetical protein [Candidatus Poribacteria bacterium]